MEIFGKDTSAQFCVANICHMHSV